MSQDPAEQNIQMWKVKKLIKSLDAARGYVHPPFPIFAPAHRTFQSGYFHDLSHHPAQGA